jgi:hypothetical protein
MTQTQEPRPGNEHRASFRRARSARLAQPREPVPNQSSRGSQYGPPSQAREAARRLRQMVK